MAIFAACALTCKLWAVFLEIQVAFVKYTSTSLSLRKKKLCVCLCLCSVSFSPVFEPYACTVTFRLPCFFVVQVFPPPTALTLKLSLWHTCDHYLPCRPTLCLCVPRPCSNALSVQLRLRCTCNPQVASRGDCPMRKVFRSSVSRSQLALCVAGVSLAAGQCHLAARPGCGSCHPSDSEWFLSGNDSTPTALWPCTQNIFAS